MSFLGFLSDGIEILVIWILAVMSPGADTFIIINLTLKYGKRNAVSAILGIITGTIIWLIVGFFFNAVLRDSWVFLALKILGGGYLIYLGLNLLKKLKKHEEISQKTSIQNSKKTFFIGLLTNLSNPKAAIFISIILSKLNTQTPQFVLSIMFILMLCIVFSWFFFVVNFLSIKAILNKFLKHIKKFDLASGIIFIFFGSSLVYDGVRDVY